MRRLERRNGMTLIEVIAALGIASIVLLGGAVLLGQVNDSGARIAGGGNAQTHEGNAFRAVRRLLREATISADSTKRFRGDARSVDYYTKCQEPGGWSSPCHVTLAVDSTADSSAIIAQLDGGARFTLQRRAGSTAFRFFDYTSRDSVWVGRWSTSATLPSAIGIIVNADTVVYPVGPARE